MNSCFVVSLLLSVFFIVRTLRTEAAPYYKYHDCPNTTLFDPNSTYWSNLDTLLTYLSSAATNSTNGFASATFGQNPPDQTYGLFLCRGDLDAATCSNCVATGKQDIFQKCSNRRVSIIWYDQCMLRYSDQDIFSVMEESPNQITYKSGAIDDTTRVIQLSGATLADLITRASAGGLGKKVAAAELDFMYSPKLYALVQCTPDLTAGDCKWCLRWGTDTLSLELRGGTVLAPSCNVRYELYPFYNTTALLEPAPAPMPVPPPAPAPAPPSTAPMTRLKGTSLFFIACLPPCQLPFSIRSKNVDLFHWAKIFTQDI